MEQEYNRLHACVTAVTGWVLNEDLDLVGLSRKLLERGVSTYNEVDGAPTSPVLEQVVSYVVHATATLMQEHFVTAGPACLVTERINFNVRTNSLRVHALLVLEEIAFFSSQVFEQLDDWVVASV